MRPAAHLVIRVPDSSSVLTNERDVENYLSCHEFMTYTPHEFVEINLLCIPV